MKNYYELLGVDQNASAEEITKAYRKTALLVHPDRHQKHSEWATEAFKHLQHIYNTLIDPQLRAKYDELIKPKLGPKPRRETQPKRSPFKRGIDVFDTLIAVLFVGFILFTVGLFLVRIVGLITP